MISPSGWNPQEAEIRTITEINGGTECCYIYVDVLNYLDLCAGRITLNESLAHDHVIYSFMEPSDLQAADPPQTSGSPQWWDDGGQMAPEVGLLSHNIVIQGTNIGPLTHFSIILPFISNCRWRRSWSVVGRAPLWLSAPSGKIHYSRIHFPWSLETGFS